MLCDIYCTFEFSLNHIQTFDCCLKLSFLESLTRFQVKWIWQEPWWNDPSQMNLELTGDKKLDRHSRRGPGRTLGIILALQSIHLNFEPACILKNNQDTGSRSRKEATERWRDATDCSRRTLWRGRPNWLGTSVAKGMHGLSSNISLPIGHSIYFADERWIPRSRLARWGCAGGSFGIAAVSFHFVKWCPRQWLLRNCNARRVMWMCLKITELCEGNSTVFFFCEKSPPRNCPTYPKKLAQ